MPNGVGAFWFVPFILFDMIPLQVKTVPRLLSSKSKTYR